MPKRIHLVLGAGGVKTLSYAGALECLTADGFEIASVSAASGGSFFGALLAGGVDPGELQSIIDDFDLKEMAGRKNRFALLPIVGSMWRWPFASHREPALPARLMQILGSDPTFRELKLPFATVGLDIVTRRLLVYSDQTTPDMKVSEALKIAIAVPFLYPPNKRGARLIVDGALSSPFPVWLATEHAESLPIVLLRPQRPLGEQLPKSPFELLGRLLDGGGASRDEYAMNNISRKVVVDIDVGDVRFDDFNLSREKRELMALAGQQAASRALPMIHAIADGTVAREPEEHRLASDSLTNDDRAEAGAARAMDLFGANLNRRVRDRVFISYAREDRQWLDRVKAAMRPFVGNKNAIWTDDDIGPGKKWFDEIDLALRKTRVAVLLVTHDYLASDFVMEHELPRFVQAAEDGGLALLWVAVGASGASETALNDFQASNNPEAPLNGLSRAEVDQALVELGKQVKVGLM